MSYNKKTIESIKLKDHEAYYNHIHRDIEVWTKLIKNLMNRDPEFKKLIQNKITVYDIGAGLGGAIIALAKMNVLKEAHWIDPNYKAFKEHLDYCEFNSSFFKKNNIKIVRKDGLDQSIDYNKADLIIKTFNGWISWNDILKTRINSDKKELYIITSILPDDSFANHSLDIIYNTSNMGNNYCLLKK